SRLSLFSSRSGRRGWPRSYALALDCQQKIAAKALLAVEPGAVVNESGLSSQPRDVVGIILVRVLGMDLFTLTELHFHFEFFNRNRLLAHALDVNFNSANCFVIES